MNPESKTTMRDRYNKRRKNSEPGREGGGWERGRRWDAREGEEHEGRTRVGEEEGGERGTEGGWGAEKEIAFYFFVGMRCVCISICEGKILRGQPERYVHIRQSFFENVNTNLLR